MGKGWAEPSKEKSKGQQAVRKLHGRDLAGAEHGSCADEFPVEQLAKECLSVRGAVGATGTTLHK